MASQAKVLAGKRELLDPRFRRDIGGVVQQSGFRGTHPPGSDSSRGQDPVAGTSRPGACRGGAHASMAPQANVPAGKRELLDPRFRAKAPMGS